ncbi:MAG: hypothetical protein VX498_14710 [Myxococcota bacterium]|nr:hypothetical protein [Myxococcota bacterium]
MSSAARLVLLVVAVLGASLGGVLCTESSMGVPPLPLGLLALGAVVVFAVVLGRAGEAGRARTAGTLILLVLLGVVAGQEFLRPGIARGHDVTHHAWAYWSLWRSVLDGDVYPRWNPYLALGIPLLQFYCPVGYVAGWPAQLLGASPLQAMASVLIAAQVAGAGAAYASVRWLGGTRAAALVAAFALALAPYHLLDQNFRVALGETIAFAWMTPVFAAGWKLGRGERGAAPWVLGLGLSLLLLTHVLTLIMVIFTLVLLVAAARMPGGRPVRRLLPSLGSLALCGALAAGATAAWWLPVVVEQEHTSISRLSRPGRSISRYAVTADEPLRRRLWARYDVRRSLEKTDSPGLAMPMYFGWGLGLLLLLALVRPRRHGEEEGGSRWFGAVALLLLLLTLHPLARVLDGMPLLGRIMFPWRLYAPATALTARAAAGAFDGWTEPLGRSRSLVLAGLLSLLAWDAAPYLGAAERYPAPGPEGFSVFDGKRAVPTELPRDRFIRIEEAPLPPVDYGWKVAKSRWIFSEYMAPALRKRYGKLSRPPSVETSEFFGAEVRFSRHRSTRQPLKPQPIAEYRVVGGDWSGIDPERWRLRPERIEVDLPEALAGGDLRFKQAWFPGWQVRRDDGPWEPALASPEHLLQTSVAGGTRQVVFRYSWLTPWDRPVGLAVSLLTLLLLVGWRGRLSAARG